MPDPIEKLRQNIRKLKPDGADGFEGLLAAVLTELTNRSFALASAGSQRGKDGQSALDDNAIMFEAKRYDDEVPKDKLYTKVFEIVADPASRKTELFILGATCAISTQHRATLEDGAREFSIPVVTVAWPDTGLPELAALLAMAPHVSAEFIAKHTTVAETELAAQLSAVAADPQFKARSEELLASLRQPSIAPAFALKDNIVWLSKAFSNAKRARSVFGQALCPSDSSIVWTVDRTDLRTKVATSVFAKPDGSVTAILGTDGTGKSWIFAQAWSHQPAPPLTIVIVPDDLNAAPSREYCNDLLIQKLLTQTDDTHKQEAARRWHRHFQRWKEKPDTVSPRLVVFMDGINQRENIDWLRFIDAMSDVLAEIGGRLAFSSRRFFYDDMIRGRLISKVNVIEVSEWNDQELEKLLRERGSSIQSLDATIVRSLRNPRIFGVAATLFSADEIKEFGELSVNRLLFEHIRTGSAVEGASLSPRKFSNEICTHARDIVERLMRQDTEDLNAFDMHRHAGGGQPDKSNSNQFVITAAGRFFEVLDENPGRYILKDEGLPLALGLALVQTAREALRKGKSVEEALSNLLDPIAALDMTSDILMGAILSAVLETSPADVVAPLVRSFVLLQNLSSSRYPEFRSLFSRSPEAFIAALEESVLSNDVIANLFWLIDAVNDLRDAEPFETALATAIHRWLNMYSLTPERMVSAPNNPEFAEERKTKRAEREKQLSNALASFSPTENSLLGGMTREERGNYSNLSLLAFQAMAGRPLAPFSESLRNWCFASSLNGGYRDHHDEFNALLRFNLSDWAATKTAMAEAAKRLRETGISETGQWALIYVLRAVGDSDDAEEADKIARELTKDRPDFKGWRLVEDYCATDPCDPASEKPDNIDKTATAYEAIDPADLRRFMSHSQSDHFFTMALTGLARFRPDAAIKAIRALADSAPTRALPEFRTAVFTLEDHGAALEDRVAIPYVRKADEIAQAALDAGEDKNDEALVTAQFSLKIAFAHMSGDAQFDALLRHPKSRTILVDLGDLFQPVDETKLELALEGAVREANSVSQFRVLAFAEYSQTPLTARTKQLVLDLLGSSDDHVRLSALGLIRESADPFLVAGLVESGWSAETLDAATQRVEIYHGSAALVLAAEQGAISVEACLDRIGLSAYTLLAERLATEAVLPIATRLDAAISKVIDFQVTGNLPEIVQTFEGPHWPVVFDVSDRRTQQDSSVDQLRRLSETGDAWYERQRQNHEAADCFERDLSKSGAQLIIQSMTLDLLAAIDKADPALVDSWCALFLRLRGKALNNVHNIALVAASAISKRDAKAGMQLFDHLKASSPPVRVTVGEVGVDLDAVAVWDAAANSEMKEFCFARLDRMGNDHGLAMEILAASRTKRTDLLRDYVLDRRQREEPAHRARAVMVAGLSPNEPWAIETVNAMKNAHGFLRQAYQAARYAMDRHQWSLHWTAQMRASTDPEALWLNTVILSKIVDARLTWPEIQGNGRSSLVRRFRSTLSGQVRNRIRKWKQLREPKLFGMSAPSHVFLPGDAVRNQ